VEGYITWERTEGSEFDGSLGSRQIRGLEANQRARGLEGWRARGLEGWRAGGLEFREFREGFWDIWFEVGGVGFLVYIWFEVPGRILGYRV
jgi:hypothetical protein